MMKLSFPCHWVGNVLPEKVTISGPTFAKPSFSPHSLFYVCKEQEQWGLRNQQRDWIPLSPLGEEVTEEKMKLLAQKVYFTLFQDKIIVNPRLKGGGLCCCKEKPSQRSVPSRYIPPTPNRQGTSFSGVPAPASMQGNRGKHPVTPRQTPSQLTRQQAYFAPGACAAKTEATKLAKCLKGGEDTQAMKHLLQLRRLLADQEKIYDPYFIVHELIDVFKDQKLEGMPFRIREEITSLLHPYLHRMFVLLREQCLTEKTKKKFLEGVEKGYEIAEKEEGRNARLMTHLVVARAAIESFDDTSSMDWGKFGMGILKMSAIAFSAEVAGKGVKDVVQSCYEKIKGVVTQKISCSRYEKILIFDAFAAQFFSEPCSVHLEEFLHYLQTCSNGDWEVLCMGIDILDTIVGYIIKQSDPLLFSLILRGNRRVWGIKEYLTFDQFKFQNNWRVRSMAIILLLRAHAHENAKEPFKSEMGNLISRCYIYEADAKVRKLLEYAEEFSDMQRIFNLSWNQQQGEVEEKITQIDGEMRLLLEQFATSQNEELKKQIEEKEEYASIVASNLQKMSEATNEQSSRCAASLEKMLTEQRQQFSLITEQLNRIETGIREQNNIEKVLRSHCVQLGKQLRVKEGSCSSVKEAFLQFKCSLEGNDYPLFNRSEINLDSGGLFELASKMMEFIESDEQKTALLFGQDKHVHSLFIWGFVHHYLSQFCSEGSFPFIPLVIPRGREIKSSRYITKQLYALGFTKDHLAQMRNQDPKIPTVLFMNECYFEFHSKKKIRGLLNFWQKDRLVNWNNCKLVLYSESIKFWYLIHHNPIKYEPFLLPPNVSPEERKQAIKRLYIKYDPYKESVMQWKREKGQWDTKEDELFYDLRKRQYTPFQTIQQVEQFKKDKDGSSLDWNEYLSQSNFEVLSPKKRVSRSLRGSMTPQLDKRHLSALAEKFEAFSPLKKSSESFMENTTPLPCNRSLFSWGNRGEDFSASKRGTYSLMGNMTPRSVNRSRSDSIIHNDVSYSIDNDAVEDSIHLLHRFHDPQILH